MPTPLRALRAAEMDAAKPTHVFNFSGLTVQSNQDVCKDPQGRGVMTPSGP